MRLKIKKIAILCFISILLSGCGSGLQEKTSPLQFPKEETPPVVLPSQKPVLPKVTIPTVGDRDYVLGPEDVIKIVVWDHEDLSREVHISREGKFSYPLIGKVSADELTTPQLEKHIAARLANGYLVDPQVSISIVEYKSKKVFVLTGTMESITRDKAKEKIRFLGGIISESVSKKIDFVIVVENSGARKYNKARELGIKIINEKQFLEIIK